MFIYLKRETVAADKKRSDGRRWRENERERGGEGAREKWNVYKVR